LLPQLAAAFSDATTCHHRPYCSDQNQNSYDDHVCSLAQGSFEYSQHCTLHHSRCVANDVSRADFDYRHCHAGLFGYDDRFLVIGVVQRCFAAVVHLATRCSYHAVLVAAEGAVSR
jgi:hypothetical protein